MPRILCILHTFTHALHQGYSLIYIHSHIQQAKDTPYYTYTHTYNIHYAKDIPTNKYTHTYSMLRILPILHAFINILC